MSIIDALDNYGVVASEAQTTLNLCQTSCVAACCMKGTVIELEGDEAAYLMQRGGKLDPVPEGEWPRGYKPPRGRIPYALGEDCPNLDQDTRLCTDYDNRPKVCGEFRASENTQSGCYRQRSVMAARITGGVVELGMPLMPRFEDMQRGLLQH